MATSSIDCIFTVSRGHLDEDRKISKKKFLSWTPFRNKLFPKSKSIDGSNPCVLRVNPECVEIIHRAYAVAMALPEIEPGPGGRRGTKFCRRGPWGGLLCAVWDLNKTTKGSSGYLTRRWAQGPANSFYISSSSSSLSSASFTKRIRVTRL